ncbi:MAG: Cna B-type domain-containing protein [Clostridia bacterium]|nr:Cna B-type domain-containing protein [Clostridia bacterium]
MKETIKKLSIVLVSIILILVAVRAGISIASPLNDPPYYENTETVQIGGKDVYVADLLDDQYKTEAILNNNVLTYNARDIATYTNLFCIQHSQSLDELLYKDSDGIKFKVTAVADIKGNNATFYSINSEGQLVQNGTVNSSYNNIFAGILTEKDPNALVTAEEMKQIAGSAYDPSVHQIYKGYGCLPVKTSSNNGLRYSLSYAVVQLAVYQSYNDWVSAIGGKGFSADANNTYTGNLDAWKITATKSYINKITSKTNNTTYNAKIYLLDAGISNIQDLIIVEIEDKIDIPVTKVWKYDTNTGNRPDSITVKLYANNKDTGKTLTLKGDNVSDSWSGTFTELEKTDDSGKEITYTVKEEVPIGYAAEPEITGNMTSGFTITNTLKSIDVSVEKSWDDEDNVEGLRPTSITVALYENGTSVRTAVLNEGNHWKYTFRSLPEYKNGKEVAYTVKETNKPEGYTTAITGNVESGFTITNIHIPEKNEIKVTKVWKDDDNLDGLRPTSITVTLYKNGSETNQKLTLDESNNWTGTFKDLYKYENGSIVNYTVKETGIPEGYTSEITGDMTTGYTITNTHKPHYDGYIEINGKVWLDGVAGKANEIDGQFKDGEKGLGGIKVILRDSSGQQFNATSTATTDSNGNYTIRVNYDDSQNVYKLYENSATVNEKLKTAYVEFEYDAMKYTTVATATTGANTSKAKENETVRNTFDSKYQTVTQSTNPNVANNENITATTKGVISLEANSEETRKEVIKYCNGNGTYIRTNPNGAWNNTITGSHSCTGCTGKGHSIITYDINVGIINNVNLGLFEREQPDVAIFSDISKVKVTMQGQEYTYLYNVRSNEKNNVGLKVKFENKDTYTYQRPVNPADIAYINETKNDLMTVDVTYEVTLANLSTTLPVTIHNITTYFDNRYTLTTTGWTQSAGTEFSTAKNTAGLNVTINPGAESEKIELTYSISLEAIRNLLNEDATLNHAVEIESYSTKYGTNTLYAEQRTGGRNNQPYAGYDSDSHPGNAGIHIDDQGRLAATNLEDDTDIAPSFVLFKDKGYYRILSGNVWEDSDANAKDAYRLGNGHKDNTDKNVENVKVELYKVKNDGTLEPAKLYFLNTDTAKVEIKDAITYTDSNGNYAFGDKQYSVVTDKYVIKFTYGEGIDGSKTSTINGSTVSARNYKSTIISQDNINVYDLFKGTSTSEEWHLNASKGYSIAVDAIDERTAISDLQYSNFGEKSHITAWSKPFTMQVEFDPSTTKSSSVEADGITIFHNELDIFDFGIIERAREDIFVETTVEYLKITLANGQVLTEGNPSVDKLNYAKPIGFNQEINNGTEARKALEKQVLIEMDAELMQGAQLEVKYAIKVTNNSEKDIDYYVDDQYKTEFYYFGTNHERAPEVNTSINYVVDYLDSQLTYTWENSNDWIQKSADELLAEGLISEATHNAIKEKEYATYITTKFSNLKPGESITDHVSAKKLLANQDENIYDNHAEILQIDAKTARTIKQTGTAKEYKMGNYVPSLAARVINKDVNAEKAGLHEQDDDRLKIVITPPTGTANYITTYVITGLVGLIVIGAVIIFIKKKVLTK